MGGKTWHALLCRTSAACISQRLISQWVIKQGWRDGQFQILLQWLHTPIQPNIMEDPPWIHHLWRIPSCPGPYKNVFQEIPNLSDQRNQPNPLRHLVAFIYIPWHICTIRNQCFFKRRHLLSPCLCKWKCFWWRTQKCQTLFCGGR